MTQILEDLVVRFKFLDNLKLTKQLTSIEKKIESTVKGTANLGEAMDSTRKSIRATANEVENLATKTDKFRRAEQQLINTISKVNKAQFKRSSDFRRDVFSDDLQKRVAGRDTLGLRFTKNKLQSRQVRVASIQTSLENRLKEGAADKLFLTKKIEEENRRARLGGLSERQANRITNRLEDLNRAYNINERRMAVTQNRLQSFNFEYDELNREIKQTTSALNKVAKSFDRVEKEANGANRALNSNNGGRGGGRGGGNSFAIGGVGGPRGLRGFLGQTAIAFGVSSGNAAAATLGFSSLAGATGPGALGLGLGIGGLGSVQLVKELDQYEALLSSVAGENENASKTFDLLADSAIRTGSSIQSNIELFNRFRLGQQGLSDADNPFIKVFGGDQRSATIQATELITKATAGLSGPSVDAALVQLSQAFSNDFQASAQELNSIFEQTPGLGAQILQGLNVLSGNSSTTTDQFARELSKLQDGGDFNGFTRGVLKQFGRDGALSAELILRALQTQESVIDKRFDKLSDSIAFREQVLQTSSLINAFKPFAEGAKIAERYNSVLLRLINFTRDNSEMFAKLGVATGRVLDFFGELGSTVSNFFGDIFQQIGSDTFKLFVETIGGVADGLLRLGKEVAEIAGPILGAFAKVILQLINLIGSIPGIETDAERQIKTSAAIDRSKLRLNEAGNGILNPFERLGLETASRTNANLIAGNLNSARKYFELNNIDIPEFLKNENVKNLKNEIKRKSTIAAFSPNSIDDRSVNEETTLILANMERYIQIIQEGNKETILAQTELIKNYLTNRDLPPEDLPSN